MGRRQGPSEERRGAILDAAEAEFTERGYAGGSIRAIARRAEVSSALLYWFFPNKAELFAAVLTRRMDAQQVLVFPPDLEAMPPAEFLPVLAQGYVRMVTAQQQIGLFKLLLRESEHDSDIMRAFRAIITNRALEPLGHYFARQIELGHVRPDPPEYITQVFIGMLIGFILRREILQEPISQTWPVADYVDHAVQLFLHGVLLDPGAHPVPPATIPTVVPSPAARRAKRIELTDED